MTLGTVLMIAANLVPAIGVIWWGWDAFVLLILYWLETAIIGFWTIVGILTGANAPAVSGRRVTGGFGLAARLIFAVFITVHAGIFMLVHFIFLWALFSGAWAGRVHGVGSFISELVIGTDLWIPLAFMFIVHGYTMFAPAVRSRLGIDSGPQPAGNDAVNGLYIRIVVMQFTIIIGAWFAMLAGDTVGPLLLLVLLKTLVDVFYPRIIAGMRQSKAGPQAPSAGSGD
jgi:hypothetical protein